jgi:hypothetical protein
MPAAGAGEVVVSRLLRVHWVAVPEAVRARRSVASVEVAGVHAAGIAPERRAAAARQSATLRALTGVRVLPRRPQPSLERPRPLHLLASNTTRRRHQIKIGCHKIDYHHKIDYRAIMWLAGATR